MADARFTLTNPGLLMAAARKGADLVGLEVLRDAKLLAPRSPRQAPPKDPRGPVTGNLKNSIAMRSSTDGTKAVVEVGTSVHYGVYQEFGTRSIPARPYLGPALEAARRKYG